MGICSENLDTLFERKVDWCLYVIVVPVPHKIISTN
jgi:hypothetical protein